MNPAKLTGFIQRPSFLRIAIPVYIPNLTGYFAQSLEILELCVESLHLSATNVIAVTVVANGCAREVVDDLGRMFDRGVIDQLIVNRTNVGKTRAVCSALKGAEEQVLAWADADVLFKRGWLEEVVRIFSAFPECASVAPFPSVHLAWSGTSATMLGAFASRLLCQRDVVPREDLDNYARSVGTPKLFKEEQRTSPWLVKRGDVLACTGSVHFVCCLRREVIGAMHNDPSIRTPLGPEAMSILDSPAENLGFWRLSTVRAKVWHMGNTVEPWMKEHVETLRMSSYTPSEYRTVLPTLHLSPLSRAPLVVRRLGARMLRRILEKRFSGMLLNRFAEIIGIRNRKS